MTLTRYIVGISLAAIALFGCSDGKSLQRYLVDKQDDDNFLKIDIAASLLQTDSSTLTQEEKDILATVKKINVVAYPIKDNNNENYDAERWVKELNRATDESWMSVYPENTGNYRKITPVGEMFAEKSGGKDLSLNI